MYIKKHFYILKWTADLQRRAGFGLLYKNTFFGEARVWSFKCPRHRPIIKHFKLQNAEQLLPTTLFKTKSEDLLDLYWVYQRTHFSHITIDTTRFRGFVDSCGALLLLLSNKMSNLQSLSPETCVRNHWACLSFYWQPSAAHLSQRLLLTFTSGGLKSDGEANSLSVTWHPTGLWRQEINGSRNCSLKQCCCRPYEAGGTTTPDSSFSTLFLSLQQQLEFLSGTKDPKTSTETVSTKLTIRLLLRTSKSL